MLVANIYAMIVMENVGSLTGKSGLNGFQGPRTDKIGTINARRSTHATEKDNSLRQRRAAVRRRSPFIFLPMLPPRAAV